MESLGAHHDLRLPSGAGLEIDGSDAVGPTGLALVPEAVLSRRPPARPGPGHHERFMPRALEDGSRPSADCRSRQERKASSRFTAGCTTSPRVTSPSSTCE